MDIAHTALVALIALALDAAFGDPDRLWRRLAHPVAVIGAAIAWLDARLNRLELDERDRRRRGVWALAALVIGAAAIGWLIALPFRGWAYGAFVEGAIASVLIAQNSLYVHVSKVRDAFSAGGLGAARQAV
ncbi:cobalamin biosynthesis protein, partial [Hansschlegelia zhihuaiae]|uniref:cobalamin biosynthesis protein n=1 Tax=Hansschlegelia zhihuaiae TaxID=405005 RepID=UPI001FE1E981